MCAKGLDIIVTVADGNPNSNNYYILYLLSHFTLLFQLFTWIYVGNQSWGDAPCAACAPINLRPRSRRRAGGVVRNYPRGSETAGICSPLHISSAKHSSQP